MRTISTTTTIDATPAEVWRALTDTAAIGTWNPFIRAIDGTLAAGERIRVRIQPPGGTAMTFRPTVRECTPEQRLAWLGRLGIPGLFDGEHSFTLTPVDGGARTRLVHAETFRGLLVAVTGRTLAKTEAGFEAFNAALAQHVERTAAA